MLTAILQSPFPSRLLALTAAVVSRRPFKPSRRDASILLRCCPLWTNCGRAFPSSSSPPCCPHSSAHSCQPTAFRCDNSTYMSDCLGCLLELILFVSSERRVLMHRHQPSSPHVLTSALRLRNKDARFLVSPLSVQARCQCCSLLGANTRSRTHTHAQPFPPSGPTPLPYPNFFPS